MRSEAASPHSREDIQCLAPPLPALHNVLTICETKCKLVVVMYSNFTRCIRLAANSPIRLPP